MSEHTFVYDTSSLDRGAGYGVREPGPIMAALEGMHRCAPTPGNCSLVRFRSYAPECTRYGVSDWPMSNTGQPLMSRITPGGGVKLGGGCIWVRIAPQAPFILAKSRAE
jgi:hypothetical protein